MTKREFVLAGLGAGLALSGQRALAQRESSPRRRIAKTTKLFKSPSGFPNAVDVTPEGLWIAEQKMTGEQAKRYGVEPAKDLAEAAWLVDCVIPCALGVLAHSGRTARQQAFPRACGGRRKTR